MSNSSEEVTSSPQKMEVEEEYKEIGSFKPLPFEDRKSHGELYRMICSGSEGTENFLEDHGLSLDMYFTIECEVGTGCSCDFLEEIIGDTDESPTNSMVASLESEIDQIETGRCSLFAALPTPDRPIRKVGCSLVHVAVRWNNFRLLQKYIEMNGDLGIRTLQSECSLLHFAVRSRSGQCLQALLRAGADVNGVDSTENTPLLYACSEENIDYMKWLIEAGSNVNQADYTQESALLNCVRNGFEEGVQLLVDKGVDVNAAPLGVPVPITEACDRGYYKIMKILVNSGRCDVDKVNNVDRHSATCLQKMIFSGEEDMVDFLLKAGADPNKKYSHDMISIIIAALTEQPEVVKSLIAYGADVNAVDDNRYTALHMAAWDGYKDIVDLLLAADAKYDETTHDLNTPIALACHGGHEEVIEVLLKQECKLDNQDKDNDTALHYAAFNGCLNSVRGLLQLGAYPDPRNVYNATPLWNAVSQRHISVVRLLLTMNVSLDVTSRGIDQHSELGDVVLIYDTPRSLLYMACSMGQHELMHLLVAAGADVRKESCIRDGTFPSISQLTLFCNPLTLKQLARIHVRKSLNMDIKKDLESMNIPHTLKSYLTFAEL